MLISDLCNVLPRVVKRSQEAVDEQSKSSSDEACAQSVNGGGSEVSGLRQYKRKAKQLTAKNDNAEVNVNIVTENELMVRIDEGSGIIFHFT